MGSQPAGFWIALGAQPVELMRKVLFLAYLFPPIVNSGTRRSLAFANNLPDCGWKPLVLSWEPDHTVSCDVESLAQMLLEWLRGEGRVEPARAINLYTRAATTRRLASVLGAAAEGRHLEPLR